MSDVEPEYTEQDLADAAADAEAYRQRLVEYDRHCAEVEASGGVCTRADCWHNVPYKPDDLPF